MKPDATFYRWAIGVLLTLLLSGGGFLAGRYSMKEELVKAYQAIDNLSDELTECNRIVIADHAILEIMEKP